VAIFENRLPVTVAKFITKSSLFILLPGIIRWLEMKRYYKERGYFMKASFTISTTSLAPFIAPARENVAWNKIRSYISL